MDEPSFGYWLKRKRKARDLTQAELANQVFCSLATIRKIEAQERRPSRIIAERLAEVFDIPQKDREAFLQFARGIRESVLGETINNSSWHNLPPTHRNNIPVPPTSFIGREKDLKEIFRLLERNRLVTVTGPGGVGKTRLVIESSKNLFDKIKDGVYWVELGAINDETLIPQAIARALGVFEIPGSSLDELVFNFINQKELLLVLDNCEHLIGPCAEVADRLLGSCPNLKILTTSREALGLEGEMIWPVPILPLPVVQHISLVDLLMEYDGIRLFVERASAVKPDFRLNEQNARFVVQVCQRLDGMPLAIELAAVRTRMMSVEEIAKHLDDRFTLLTTGSRTAFPRHRTLRAAIDWSYELLSETERILFYRLSIFTGGFNLDAAEEVATGGKLGKTEIIDLLGQLINKSLVMVRQRTKDLASETRYEMLETIHAYALERLDESGEGYQVRQRHRDYFVAFAEDAVPKLKGAQQLDWLERLEAEHDNLRSVLAWTMETKDAAATLGLAGKLSYFWDRRSYLSEGRLWLERGLTIVNESTPTSLHAEALFQAAWLARAQGDFIKAHKFIEESIALWQTFETGGRQGLSLAKVLLGNLYMDEGDPIRARNLTEDCVVFFRKQKDIWNLAWSLCKLGRVIRDQEDYALAWSYLEESVALWRQQEDAWGLADALHNLGLVAYRQGNYATAYSLFEEDLMIQRKLGNKRMIAYSSHCLGLVILAQGDIDKARPFFDQGLVLFREVGDKSGIALTLQYQGLFAHIDGEEARAQSLFEDGLRLARETGPRWLSSNYLLWLANVAATLGQLERATWLCSAAKTQLVLSSSFWDAFECSCYEHIMALTHKSLGEDVFTLAQAKGQALTLDQAIALALDRNT
ncbi:MAG: tetratricopeptide repeat protein [Anaerolineales bacterium]|jgi:non-specific serine/threonine protein kinase